LYDLLIAIVSSNDQGSLADLEALKKNAGLDSTEWEDLLQYIAQVPFFFKNPSFHLTADFAFQVLGNLVNYKSFGFTKIIPRLAPDRFEAVVSNSTNKGKALPLWNDVRLSDSAILPDSLNIELDFVAVERSHLFTEP
jgi:dipeptidyl-peptidase-3